jgi:NAD(P)-dependent dehydrogenase (short-subunit alcohol dehydrogenase family)
MSVHPLFDLSGMCAIVTGGSRGLGFEMASALGEAGASVVITARRQSWLEEAEHLLRANSIDTLAMCCDVNTSDDIAVLTAAVLDRWGRIDILVNNAGVSWAAPAETMSLEKWHSVLETNATGTFLMSQAVGRHMIESARGGRIINIASITGLVGTAAKLLDSVCYSASKGAVIALTRDLAAKWGRHNIRVNAIAPGFFLTRLTEGVFEKAIDRVGAACPLGRCGAPGELKGVTLFLASDASSYVTGQIIAVDGGHTAW